VIGPHGAAADSSRRPWLRRVVPLGLICVGVLMLVGLAAWLLLRPPSYPLSRMIAWQRGNGFLGTPRFDPTTAGTATSVQISVDWLTCAPQDASWLAPPEVSYSWSTVTITMHTTDVFAVGTTCGGGNLGKGDVGVMLDVGIPVEVLLSEPLRGRALFAGVSSGSLARPYP
jgi:hypothetical protein